MPPRLLLSPLLPLVLCLLLAGCRSQEQRAGAGDSAAASGDGRLDVVCTTAMVGDVAAAVGGDRVDVTVLMGPGTDPHTYPPNRSDIARLLNADVVFYSGLHLEGQLQETLERAKERRPAVAVADHIPQDRILMADGVPDPHLWMDAKLWAETAAAIADTLAEADPEGAEAYRANAAAYRGELEKLDAYIREVLASVPDSQRVLVTAHDAFHYLGEAYGIEVVGIQGISTESEASLQDINRLVDMLVERRIPAVFVETSVADKNVRALIEGAQARGHKVRVGGELFSDAMGAAGTYEGTYLGMLDHNATVISRALGGQAPERGMQGKLNAAPEAPEAITP